MISLIDQCDADGSLKAKNVYLYFLQMGKDMYTGEDISLEELKSPDKRKKHNIDHIYPKHFVKDESIDNLVLTNTDLNRDLSDRYPVPQDIYDNMHEFWQQLRRSGLISAESWQDCQTEIHCQTRRELLSSESYIIRQVLQQE